MIKRIKLPSIQALLHLNQQKKQKPEDEDERGDPGRSGAFGGRGSGDNRSKESHFSSLLAEESRSMERQRRILEQQGHRHLARVNARDHANDERSTAPEGEFQNDIRQNPWLNSQRFDGVDSNLNPEPPLNTEARREFDNQRREQELEKQLRLGNMPNFNSAPKPQGP